MVVCSGGFFCLLYKLGLQTGFPASASASELGVRTKQTFAINPALLSGVREIVSFMVRLNIVSPSKL